MRIDWVVPIVFSVADDVERVIYISFHSPRVQRCHMKANVVAVIIDDIEVCIAVGNEEEGTSQRNPEDFPLMDSCRLLSLVRNLHAISERSGLPYAK
jgi:hypothetical protein